MCTYKHICECTQKSQERSFQMSEGAIYTTLFPLAIAMTIKNQQGNNTSKTRVPNLDSLEGQQDSRLRFIYLPLSTTYTISLICSAMFLIASNLVTTSTSNPW